MAFQRICIVLTLASSALASRPVFACGCAWFFDKSNAERDIARAAFSVDYVVTGTIVGETATGPLLSQSTEFCPGVAYWRVLRVTKIISQNHGHAFTRRAPFDITVKVGRFAGPSYACDEVTSCDVWPRVGDDQTWALIERLGGQFEFANSCTTDAVRRAEKHK